MLPSTCDPSPSSKTVATVDRPRLAGRARVVQTLVDMMTATTVVQNHHVDKDEGSVVLHADFDIGDQSVPDADGISIVDLPGVRVAAVIHRAPMDNIAADYEALVRWIEDHGYQLAGRSRKLYHEWNEHDPEQSVTELQLPIVD
jgi:effector-binding domain-containing protein